MAISTPLPSSSLTHQPAQPTSTPAPPTLTAAEAALIPSRTLPIASQLHHLLTEFTTLTLSLFSSLSAQHVVPTFPTYAALAVLDQKLVAVLALADEHRRGEQKVEALIEGLRETDERWRKATQTLHDSIASLDPVVASGKMDRQAISASSPTHNVLTPATVLSYARLLAPFTSAPPASLYPIEERVSMATVDPTGRGLPAGARPPFPTEGIMRRGRLQFANEDEAGMGEIQEVGVRREDELAKEDRKLDPTAQLQQHARHLEHPPPPPEEDLFDFDLDLNPDL